MNDKRKAWAGEKGYQGTALGGFMYYIGSD